jgi:hypothetical protein
MQKYESQTLPPSQALQANHQKQQALLREILSDPQRRQQFTQAVVSQPWQYQAQWIHGQLKQQSGTTGGAPKTSAPMPQKNGMLPSIGPPGAALNQGLEQQILALKSKPHLEPVDYDNILRLQLEQMQKQELQTSSSAPWQAQHQNQQDLLKEILSNPQQREQFIQAMLLQPFQYQAQWIHGQLKQKTGTPVITAPTPIRGPKQLAKYRQDLPIAKYIWISAKLLNQDIEKRIQALKGKPVGKGAIFFTEEDQNTILRLLLEQAQDYETDIRERKAAPAYKGTKAFRDRVKALHMNHDLEKKKLEAILSNPERRKYFLIDINRIPNEYHAVYTQQELGKPKYSGGSRKHTHKSKRKSKSTRHRSSRVPM